MAVFRVISGLVGLGLGLFLSLYYIIYYLLSHLLYSISISLLFSFSLFLFLFCTSFISFFTVIGAGVWGFAAAIPLNLRKNGIIMLKKHSKLLIITHVRIFIKF